MMKKHGKIKLSTSLELNLSSYLLAVWHKTDLNLKFEFENVIRSTYFSYFCYRK